MTEATRHPNDQEVDGHQEEQEVTGLQEYNAAVLDSAPGVRQAFLEMLLKVPEPEQDSDAATVAIVGAILGAQDVKGLNKPFDSDGMRDHFGQTLIVKSITRRRSDYTGGLGAYLGCQCVIGETGEVQFVTCGGVSAVAQLVRAHTLGLLPLLVRPTKAEKPTTRGYWPYQFDVLGRTE